MCSFVPDKVGDVCTLQGWPKEFVMGCENFSNLCVVIGGTIGGWGLALSPSLDRYRSGGISRRIDGRKAGSSTLYSCFYGLPFAAATSSSPSQSERLTSVDWPLDRRRTLFKATTCVHLRTSSSLTGVRVTCRQEC